MSKIDAPRHDAVPIGEVDPIADDGASLGFDLRVRETGDRRGVLDPFLTGY